jgi:hypothetical protein
MRKLIASLILLTSFNSFSQVRMPQASPTQMITQEFGLGKIELTYSRPLIKGRALLKEKSELAPYGQVWRTGANSVTKLRFTDIVTIGGNKLDSGTYALYTIPGKKEWTIIINKGSKNWGTVYNEPDDVMRFKVPASKLKNKAESFTMQFSNVLPESCELHLIWGNADVTVPITTDITDRIRTQLETALSGTTKPYFAAANFYYEYDKDYAKALTNVDKAINENKEAYWVYLLKARIQKATGDKAGAKATAEIAIEKATAQKNDDYVRGGKELIKSL